VVTYADSSFLVSSYVQDSHTESAKKFLALNAIPLILTSFSKTETQHAIRMLAFRKLITIGEMTQGLMHLDLAQDDGVYELRLIEPGELFQKASQLSHRHALEYGVRFLDMLHVASAQIANAKRFLTFDLRQRKFAAALGLDVKI
jgi:predicted nucleic acid-binding protein